MREAEFIGQVYEGLKDNLNEEKFSVIPKGYAVTADSYDFAENPDLAVISNETGKVTLIEAKGTSTGDDIPLGAISHLKALKLLNQRYDPKVLLVSKSRVSPNLQKMLHDSSIDCVHWENAEKSVEDLLKYFATIADSADPNTASR